MSKYNQFLKILTTREDFENLLPKYFIQVSFDDLKVGDIIKTSTMTFSQKYTIHEGYEEYNMVKLGVLLEKNEKNPGSSRIYRYNDNDFEETNLYSDPGTSGSVAIYKYMEYLEN